MMNKKEALKEYIEGSYIYDPMGSIVYASLPKEGITLVCNIRGWGFLTGEGSGACHIVDTEAVKIMDKVGYKIAAVNDMYNALKYKCNKCMNNMKNEQISENDIESKCKVCLVNQALNKADNR